LSELSQGPPRLYYVGGEGRGRPRPSTTGTGPYCQRYQGSEGRPPPPQVMNETNIPKSPLYRRLDKLVRLGYLEEAMKGNTKVYRCKRGCS